MAADVPRVVDGELLLKVAKNLQAIHSRQTLGEARKWRDVSVEERQTWMRLARGAARLLIAEPEQSAPKSASP
jgi:hypothetical protein